MLRSVVFRLYHPGVEGFHVKILWCSLLFCYCFIASAGATCSSCVLSLPLIARERGKPRPFPTPLYSSSSIALQRRKTDLLFPLPVFD